MSHFTSLGLSSLICKIRLLHWIVVLKNCYYWEGYQFSSVAQSCLTFCNPMNCSTPGVPIYHQLPEFTLTHIQPVGDAIQPSHRLSSPSPPAPNPSQHQSLYQWVNSSHEVTKVLEFQLQHHSFQRNPRTDLLQNGLVGSPCSPRDSQESSPTPQFKSITSSALNLLYSPTLTSIYDYWKKTIALTRQTCVGKVMSLLLNMLSRLVITFLPRSKHLLISWLQSTSAVILEPPKIKSLTVSIISPSICHEVMGPDAMIFIFWMLSFKPAFSLSSFTFTKRLFSSSLLSAIRVVSSAYLRLLIFLPAILILAVLPAAQHFTWCPLHIS